MKKDSTGSKFGQSLVANSVKQALLANNIRNRLRAKLGKPVVEQEIQINAHGQNVAQSSQMELKKHCGLCNQHYLGYGNNPSPIECEGRVCDDCNYKFVIPRRFADVQKNDY